MEECGRSIIFLLGPISCGTLQYMNSKSGFMKAFKRDSFHIFNLPFIMNVRQDTPPASFLAGAGGGWGRSIPTALTRFVKELKCYDVYSW